MSFSSQIPSSRGARRRAEEFSRLLKQAEMRVENEKNQLLEEQASSLTGKNAEERNLGSQESTSQSELVVDLPQGQKLIVKNISPGTIVEVASWSGKSGPDEGAIRMLFGASSNREGDPLDSASLIEADSAKGSLDVFPADEVRDETGVEGVVNPHTSDASLTRKSSDAEFNISRKEKVMKRAALIGGVIIALVAMVVGLRAAQILYFEHPQGGITTGLGAASSAVVAVSPQADISPNSTVVINVDSELLLVAVAEVGGDQLLVTTGDGRLVVSQDELVGRVLFVIPFLGYLSLGGSQ